MKLLFLVAALGLAAPVLAEKAAPPPVQDKKDCRHNRSHGCKAERARAARPASGTFTEEKSHLATQPMAPSLPG